MKERGKIEKLWREEKYRVLLHDQNAYNKIRALLKESPSLEEVQFQINEAINHSPTTGSIINAYEHMWGYFKNIATDNEKHKALMLKDDFMNHQIELDALLSYLSQLANKYDIKYLQESTILNKKDLGENT
ncbi:YbgA family protein [Staphylococcus capitis]|uniref:YbgA family protein n=1 Tax=Staphylococcus capitis TaxID=29388 RepID=UPI001D149AA1|nr:YbgA family protein [Staphylococcus capitis]MCC3755831.1 YbgA family protein [Staphylococcus capitis]MDH8729428.1 YbgA family protein [Staphylococcus capitis]MDH8921612.1 YbgA family protein [Staphylococcus capitis]MDH8942815.1 YbgA family protein [Staphylococcus capitis]MDH9592527.1 YbgA family protein [Staphylococcus capitis]